MTPANPIEQRLDTRKATRLARFVGACFAVGLLAGGGAILFHALLDLTRYIFLDYLAGYHADTPGGEVVLFETPDVPLRRWVLVILPAAGGLISGWLVYKYAPEAAGGGNDAVIDSYHHHNGKVRNRVAAMKGITSAIIMGTGGSAGREGPIAQIGASLASSLASRLPFTENEKRTLMAAGAAAGIGAIFHAPLAGALFVAEVFYRDMDLEHEVLVPAFISSVTAYSIFGTVYGWNPMFVTPEYVFENPAQLFPYAILAVLLAGLGVAYVRYFQFAEARFADLRVPVWLKPAIGGLLVGMIGFAVPSALGTGYGIIQTAIDNKLGVGVLLGLALCKIVSTSFTVGSGGSGGKFGPTIVVGGAFGGAVGILLAEAFPGMDIQPGAFLIVGMAAFFAAVSNCPISSIIMVSEMTGNFHLLVPSMFVCILAYLLGSNHSLFNAQLPSRLEAPSKMGNMLSAVLRTITVRNALGISGTEPAEGLLTVPQHMTLSELIEKFTDSDQSCFPVVDGNGALIGMISSEDIRFAVTENVVAELIVAHDIAKPPKTVTTTDTLLRAARKLVDDKLTALVVVDAADPTRPLSTLNQDHIIYAYSKQLLEEGR